jgi:hypothetical protein
MINRVVALDLLMEAAHDFAKRLIAKNCSSILRTAEASSAESSGQQND